MMTNEQKARVRQRLEEAQSSANDLVRALQQAEEELDTVRSELEDFNEESYELGRSLEDVQATVNDVARFELQHLIERLED